MGDVKFVSAAGAFTQGQYIYPDTIMAPGALMLVDPGHSQGVFSGGLGTTGGSMSVPNVAASVAAGLAASTPANCNPTLQGTYAANALAFERTSKLGLHGVTSQVNMSTSLVHNIQLELPAALKAYIQANLGHTYYYSIWYRPTRAAGGANTTPMAALGNAPGVSQGLLNLIERTGPATATANAFNTPARNTLANTFDSYGIAGWQGTQPANVAAWSTQELWGVGVFGPWGATQANTYASMILYRVYLEDLTASQAVSAYAGRTWASVEAADLALFNTAFGVGGKFYNDTFTAPGTLLP